MPTPPQAAGDLVERMAAAMQAADGQDCSLVPRGPHSRFWDHGRRCMVKDLAKASAAQYRRELPSKVGGQRIRWRVRLCPVCGGFYVDSDASSRGDLAAQRRRKRERQEH